MTRSIIMKSPRIAHPLALAFFSLVVLGIGCTTPRSEHRAASAITLPDLPDLKDYLNEPNQFPVRGDYYKITYRLGDSVASVATLSVVQKGEWLIMESFPAIGDSVYRDRPSSSQWLLASEVVSIEKTLMNIVPFKGGTAAQYLGAPGKLSTATQP